MTAPLDRNDLRPGYCLSRWPVECGGNETNRLALHDGNLQ